MRQRTGTGRVAAGPGDRAAAEVGSAAPLRSIEVCIDSLAAGGDGVGRAPDGRTVFVPETAPGDRVRVRIVQERARFLRGRVETLLVPGPARTEPVCPVYGSCGGCTWQHVDYAAQVRAKELILRDSIQRIGKLSLPGEVKMTPSPSPYGYRGRARVLIRDGRVGFRRRRSHALCPTRRCPILVSPLEEALRRLAEAAPGEDGQWELLAGVELAVRSVPVSPEDTTGEKIRVAVGRHRLQISPGVFVQSNVLLLEPLAAAVHEAAGQGQVAVELYAGAGFLTLGLAELFRRVVAVEAQPAAARDLAANCRAVGLTNVRVLNERAEQALAQPDRLPERPDLAVLDPPRSGLGPESVRALARLAPRRIVALSCNPATLARDLADLRSLGYALRHLLGFDVFPQTPHLEALAVLEAQAGGV